MLDAATWDVVVADARACEIDAEVLVLEHCFILDELVVRVEASLGDQKRVDATRRRPRARPARRRRATGYGAAGLTPTEFRLLRFLMRHRGRALAKERILANVWPHDFNGDRSVVETYVSYLRRKIDRGRGAADPHRARVRVHDPPARLVMEIGPRRSDGEARVGTAGAPAPSPAASE